MDGLHRGRHLGVRGCEQAGDLVGKRLVGGKPGELALPEVEIAPGQPVEIGGMFVVFSGHGVTIAYRRATIVTDRSARPGQALLVALRHRR